MYFSIEAVNLTCGVLLALCVMQYIYGWILARHRPTRSLKVLKYNISYRAGLNQRAGAIFFGTLTALFWLVYRAAHWLFFY